jgi:hypothetical protein
MNMTWPVVVTGLTVVGTGLTVVVTGLTVCFCCRRDGLYVNIVFPAECADYMEG